MGRSPRGMLLLLGLCAWPSRLFAEPASRVRLEVAPACAAVAADLDDRLHDKLNGDEGAAVVKIEPSGAAYRVTLRTSGGLAEKVIVAPSCEEAVDVAEVVLTLAFARGVRGEVASVEASAAAGASAPVLRQPAASARVPSVHAQNRRSESARAEGRFARWGQGSSGSTAGSSLLFATGVDAGTLPVPTLYLALGFGQRVSALELRAAVKYGLPAAEEEVDGGVTDSWQEDFGAVDVRSCYGWGSAFRFSACAGGEFGVVRSAHRLGFDDGSDEDEQTLLPRLSGVLAAVLSHRAGIIRPELELSSAGVAVGRAPGAPWLVLRASAGAAVSF